MSAVLPVPRPRGRVCVPFPPRAACCPAAAAGPARAHGARLASCRRSAPCRPGPRRVPRSPAGRSPSSSSSSSSRGRTACASCRRRRARATTPAPRQVVWGPCGRESGAGGPACGRPGAASTSGAQAAALQRSTHSSLQCRAPSASLVCAARAPCRHGSEPNERGKLGGRCAGCCRDSVPCPAVPGQPPRNISCETPLRYTSYRMSCGVPRDAALCTMQVLSYVCIWNTS